MQGDPTNYYQTAPTTPIKKSITRTPSAKASSYSNHQSPAITNVYINQRTSGPCTGDADGKKAGSMPRTSKRRVNQDDPNETKRNEQIKGKCCLNISNN